MAKRHPKPTSKRGRRIARQPGNARVRTMKGILARASESVRHGARRN